MAVHAFSLAMCASTIVMLLRLAMDIRVLVPSVNYSAACVCASYGTGHVHIQSMTVTIRWILSAHLSPLMPLVCPLLSIHDLF